MTRTGLCWRRSRLGSRRWASCVVEYEEETRSHEAPTHDHSGAAGTHSLRSVHAWTKSELSPGQALCEPAPPFRKLDEGVIAEEYARLEE
jgi:hypothetical protein